MKRILSETELNRLADVIGEVEEKTCGEIRLMIVGRSSVTGHVHMLLWSLLVILTWLVFDFQPWLQVEPLWFWPTTLVVHYFVSGWLGRLPFLQRNLTPHRDLEHQVWARAEVEFHREGLSDTKSHTAVLLFVSLFERQAVVLADQAIASHVPPHTWDGVVRSIVDGARTGLWARQLEQAIRQCGEYLASHFPSGPNKTNELPNTVIVKD